MNKKIIILFLINLLFTCSTSDDSDNNGNNNNNEIIPSNLNLFIEIVGQDSTFPHGDGTGVIRCTATASDVDYFGYRFGDGEEYISNDGYFEFVYDQVGTIQYNVVLVAYSTTGHSSSISQSITVYVSNDSYQLVWSDEFNIDGGISTNNWFAETIPPNNGSWWNFEEQHYTDRLDNVFVSNGTLKIVAKRETYTFQNSTKEFTSARINTQDRFEFTYGKVEVRAKLPEGIGTWPAIWMLGANYPEVGWPVCGEIDIMEHWGHIPGIVSSATHTPSCFSGCVNAIVGETNLPNYNTEFHVYALEWDENELRFYIDGEFKYSYNPSVQNNENWPFTQDQFIILNIAMGSDWFEIDPNFNEAVMEIDYVRVYQ